MGHVMQEWGIDTGRQMSDGFSSFSTLNAVSPPQYKHTTESVHTKLNGCIRNTTVVCGNSIEIYTLHGLLTGRQKGEL